MYVDRSFLLFSHYCDRPSDNIPKSTQRSKKYHKWTAAENNKLMNLSNGGLSVDQICQEPTMAHLSKQMVSSQLFNLRKRKKISQAIAVKAAKSADST